MLRCIAIDDEELALSLESNDDNKSLAVDDDILTDDDLEDIDEEDELDEED